MAVNKVEYSGKGVLIDLTQDTVTPENLLVGVTAHNAAGESISGSVDLNEYLKKTGNTADNTVTFTSGDSTSPAAWTDVSVMESNEKHSSLFWKISTMFNNIRYLYKMLGTSDISALGGGTVTGAISALNSNLSKRKIESSFTSLHFFKFEEKIELGEYPYNKTAVYGLHSLSQFLNTEASEMYLGYVVESFPTAPMIPFVIPCLLSTQDFSVTQVASIYIKSDGGVYLSVPSALKSTAFNNILVNGVYWGYYGR